MIALRTERMSDFFTKYHIDGLPFAAVLHHFTAPDTGDPHDHPFGFRSIVLSGGYVEAVYLPNGDVFTCRREAGHSFEIEASHVHRIIDLPEGECWTLIIPGQHERTPGFYRFENGKVLHRLWNEREFRVLIPNLTP